MRKPPLLAKDAKKLISLKCYKRIILSPITAIIIYLHNK